MKLLLRNRQPPGDVLMLTAAVRDLHRSHPNTYTIAVDTACPALWENNPLVITPDSDWGPDRVIECQYPLVLDANRRAFHFIHGFVQDMERKLGVAIPPGPFRGDIYLSADEMRRPSPVAELGHGDGPYWVAVAGGKHDFTAKWWDPAFWQEVVDHFAGRIRFVQCGAGGDWHPPLEGVVKLVGKTSVRELVRLVYHAEGVVCPVTFAMHLAAAVLPRPGGPALRPCVVVAGGREPAHWEAYPGHQFLHTIGALDCCAEGGCWKSRCQPIGDGDPCDADLCVHPVAVHGGLQIAKCMTMITPARVIEAINLYYDGGILRFPQAPAPSPTRTEPTTRAGRRPTAVTIGVGPYAEIAKLAAREVEARTGLPAIVLGDREFADSGLEDPTFLKFRLFDLVDADDILYFDADIVCLEDWDPSPLFGSDSLACVRERMIPLIARESADWAVPPAEHFNSGMFVANRRHHAQWLRRAEALRFAHPTELREQLSLNAARVELGIPLKLLDRRYNWLGFGAGSLSHDVAVIMAHRLAPDRQDLNVAYYKGEYALFEPRLIPDDAAAVELRGRVFNFHDGGGGRRIIRLREDGTIMPPGDADGAGYWFVHIAKGRPTLAFASETVILHQFVRVMNGTWVALGARGLDASHEGPRLVESCAPTGPAFNEDNARAAADTFLRSAPPYPEGRFRGRGVVVCGGGPKYFPCAWVCIRMLRHVGCELPIELWHTTASELPPSFRSMIEPYNVRCIDADEVRQRHPVRALGGWQLKPFSLLHCSFEEAMLIDADNLAVRDPAYLFDAAEYRAAGAVFWPDFDRLAPDRAIWRLCGVPYRDEPEVESGQIVVDKRHCWRALQLTMHLNEHSDFYYEYIHGDKETFHMAWRMLGRGYAMVPHALEPLEGTMCQHDFAGRRLFQHRNMLKWKLPADDNPRVAGFVFEEQCRAFLQELPLTVREAQTF